MRRARASSTDPAETDSHFERFFALYRTVDDLIRTGVQVARPLATNPNTTPKPTGPVSPGIDAAVEATRSPGRIGNRRARVWAQLFNLRYRLLLGQLAHVLQLDGAHYRTPNGDRTERGLLLLGTFDEMRHLAQIAGKLVTLPLDEPAGTLRAGPPFELPYTLGLPEDERQRWRMHLEVSRAAGWLVRDALPGDDPFLQDMVARDQATQAIMASLAAGTGIPAGALPAKFAKAVTILEEAVRGFSIGKHRNLWADTKRDGFLAVRFFGSPPVGLDPNGSVDPNPANSPLINRITVPPPGRSMPLDRPPIPVERIEYLKQWISDGCPDSEPPEQVGVHHERRPAAESAEDDHT